MIVVAAGYMGTGSSAIINLLDEYDSCTTMSMMNYEHVVFYTPHGLFDLEDRLLVGNSLHNSDAAISEFYDEMRRLNDNDFIWCGGYKKRYGNQFMNIVEEFIEDITQYSMAGNWFYDMKEQKITLKGLIKDSLVALSKKKRIVNFGKRYIYKKDNIIRYSFISPNEFYTAAQKFVKSYCDMIRKNDLRIPVFNQLLLPHHLHRISRYFKEDIRVIVCNRDVRDMYILSKYIWPTMGNEVLLPANIDEFIRFHKGLHDMEIKCLDKNIKRLYFEELIYEYDNVVKEIEEFIGLKSENHISIKKEFDPSKSINNTQTFEFNEKWKKEVKEIEKYLSNYLYPFPYRRKGSIENTFEK